MVLLKKWFPQMENFSTQLKKYQITIDDLLEENSKMEERAKAGESGKMKDALERKIFEGAEESKQYMWTIAQVKSILKDENYIGNSVHNRQSNISFKNKKKVEVVLHKYQRIYWNQGKLFVSLGFSVMGIMIFMISQQPYAGFFLLCMLVIKGILALKQR